jgi:hypothetical protein
MGSTSAHVDFCRAHLSNVQTFMEEVSITT